MQRISLQTARTMMVSAQGLAHPPVKAAQKADVLAAIRRMGALQIDTIHVVARSPYLALWSRLGDYQPDWLDELLAEGALFEYWSHAMCFLPSEDFPYYRRRMLDEKARLEAGGKGYTAGWARDHPQVMEQVLEHIRRNGGAFSKDFENKDRPPGGWWNWKDEKMALEVLFLTGELMIARRQNFQRMYDLTERVLAKWADAEPARRAVLDEEEVARFLTLKSVRALGVARPEWVNLYFYLRRRDTPERLEALAQDGQLHAVELEGLPGPAYIHPDQLWMLDETVSGRLEPTHTTLLTPFDPLVSDRRRARELFGFDYTIECYTPAPKRRYGYFSLPVLQRGALVGRVDAKAHRKDGLFEVKAAHLEPGVPPEGELVADLAGALRRLAAWHGTPQVVARLSDPPELAGRLAEQFASFHNISGDKPA